MNILYIYDKMPKVYQTYMVDLLKNIKTQLNVTSFAYEKGINADIQFKTYGFSDLVQRFLYKINLSNIKSQDLKIFNRFDIIHIQHSYLFTKLKYFPNSSNTKTIITLRGADTYLKPWISKKWNDFYKEKQNKIAAFITVSKHQKEYLQKWGVPPEKIYVIPISFGDKSLFKPKSPNKRELKLVSAFRMTWEKNITDCLKFAKILKKRNIDFTYDIYGDGNDLEQVFYLVEKYNLIENISIHGKISNEEFKSRLVEYDFFLQLSISESLGATVIEAQSRGIPCLISSTDGLPETIVHNKTGYILKNDDLDEFCNTCISLWKNKDKYIEFSKNAINNANEKFTINHETNLLINLYNQISK